MEQLRAAVVGLGRMGSTIDDELPRVSPHTRPYAHAARYRAVAETKLVAGCDPEAARREAFAQRWEVPAYETVAEMMERERPEIVSVCTHTAERAAVTLEIIGYGPRAVFLEKPMAETLRQCDEILAACAGAGIISAVNCSRRWEPCYTRARELLQDMVGPLRSLTAYCNGGLSHMGSHLLDLVRYLTQNAPAQWVMGHILDPELARGEQDVAGLGLIKFAGPIHAYINMVDAGATSVEVDLVGTTGRIHLGSDGWTRHLYFTREEGLNYHHLAETPFPDDPAHPDMGRASVRDIVQCVREGGQPRCSGADGRAALELALALRASERQGGARVPLPYEAVDDPLRSV